MNCCICGVELTGENTSIEHIIPNAIGGRFLSELFGWKIELLKHIGNIKK